MLQKFCAGAVTSVLLLAGVAACSDETGPDDLEVNFAASLSGAAERPTPVTTTATGTSTVTINDANSTFTFNISVTGLLSPTMAHIHVGDANTAGPIALSLLATAPAAGLFTGVLVPTATGTAAQVTGGETFATLAAKIRAGTAYINVHTVANPGGELRGQLVAQ